MHLSNTGRRANTSMYLESQAEYLGIRGVCDMLGQEAQVSRPYQRKFAQTSAGLLELHKVFGDPLSHDAFLVVPHKLAVPALEAVCLYVEQFQYNDDAWVAQPLQVVVSGLYVYAKDWADGTGNLRSIGRY